MTALNPNNLPTSATSSVERLAAYALLLLHRLNPDLSVLEVAGQATRALQVSIITDSTGTDRIVGRLSIPLDPAYITDTTLPLWSFADDLSNTTIPDGFLD